MNKIFSLRLNHLVGVFLITFWPHHSFGQPGPAVSAPNEVEYFIAYFSDPNFEVKKEVFGELEFSGITDTRLFDIVEQRFIETSKLKGMKNVDDAAWLGKALSYSGQDKYLQTLNEARQSTRNTTFIKHLKLSIERLPQFTNWDKELVKNTEGLTGEELYRQRTVNMINAADSYLSMVGARRVWFHHPTDAQYIKVVSEKLQAEYNKSDLSRRDIDAIGWYCNVLGKSEDSSYKPILDKIAPDSSNGRIRNYAKKNSRLLK